MEWSERQQEGFALAAAAHADKDAALALRGLSSEATRTATGVVRRMSNTARETRRAWVRELLAPEALQIEPDHGIPPRALGLLASSVDRALGRRLLAQAPPPRPGYVPDPQLLSLLRKLASHPE